MRSLLTAALATLLLCGLAAGAEPANVVLKSPDGKRTYDLAKLTAQGPVLVRLTCACSGCDQELPYFQKLQAAYDAKGLKTVAVFREAPETASEYTARKGVNFLWVEDPKGELWKTFDAKTMPTNILLDKGGRVVKVLPGCTRDGKNARILSGLISRLLNTKMDPLVLTEAPAKK